MDADDFYAAWEAITVIEAQTNLSLLTVQDWTNTKQKDRQKLHKRLFEMAYPDSFKEVKQLTGPELAKILKGG